MSTAAARPAPHADAAVALVSMPWMAAAMPSIQLATLEAALRQHGVESHVYELYVDFAARIGLNNYRMLSRLLGFNAEWLFSRHYFGPETGDWLAGFLPHRPSFGLEERDLEEDVLSAFAPITEHFLEEMATTVDWSRYRLIGFSLSLTQVGASLALARRIKLRHPETPIVFGGAECAGSMGRALLRICPYVDVVVQVEGEPVLPELLRRLDAGEPLDDLPGIALRGADGEVESIPGEALYTGRPERPNLDYTPYFQRLRETGIDDRLEAWVPFESSRGCWYGQKSQCTFCGLHEIMQFRAWDADLVLGELEELYFKHGVGRFFAVDLIMPRQYLTGFLPEIERRGHRWSLFYEVKANMRRAEVEQLARAGVRWIQPGIESLDREVLDLMRKGVSPLQNVQLLKWCREYGIRVGWNLITGLPGETAAPYRRMATFLPRLVHLAPPSGLGRFQLHRFSPYFESPEEFGIRATGAHPLYQHIFPVPADDLDDLAYLHEFQLDTPRSTPEDVEPVRREVARWWRCYTRGARLTWLPQADGSARIVDRRDVDAEPVEHRLTPDEARLYQLLDTAQAASRLPAVLAKAEADAGRDGTAPPPDRVAALLERWDEQGLVLTLDGRVLALAVGESPLAGDAGASLSSPVPYLEPSGDVAAP